MAKPFANTGTIRSYFGRNSKRWLQKAGLKLKTKRCMLKDVLMNLMTRENWNKDAKADLNQIRDTLKTNNKNNNKQL
jgi:hypothetical protein